MLNARDRRALLVGGSIIGAGFLVSFIVVPAARGLSDMRQTLGSERSLLQRERGVLTRAAETNSALQHAEHELAEAAFHAFDAAEPALATRDVASLLETVAKLSGVTSIRTDPLSMESVSDGFSRVRVRVSGTAVYSNATLLFHRLEAAPLSLRIEQIALRGPGATNTDDAGSTISFSMIVQAPALADRARLASLRRADAPRPRTTELQTETELIASSTDDPFYAGVIQAESETAADVQGASTRAITLVGTVVLPGNRGVAMASTGTDAPKIVRIGDLIGGMRLRGVEPGTAEFEDENGARIVVRVSKPGV